MRIISRISRGNSGERPVPERGRGQAKFPGRVSLPGLLLVELRERGQGNFPLLGSCPPLSIENDLGGHRLLTLAAERPDEVRELGASGGLLIAE